MNRKVQYTAAIVMTVIVGAVFYYAFISPLVQQRRQIPELPAQQPESTGPRHPLTGEPRATSSDFFVAAVMFDNFETVKSRPGLEHAGIVYEALAEGGITRLMGLFDSTTEVRRFGPIRSVRPYFIDWASEYGGILMHVGGSPEALAQLKNSEAVIDIDQIGAREIYFERDESLDAPHNVFASFSSWLQIKDRMHVQSATVAPWPYMSLMPRSEASAIQQLDIIYSPDANISWVYTKERNAYLRFLNGGRQLYATGDTISASNVIVIAVPSETIDTIGRQRMQTLGTGPAQIYRNGEMIRGTWIKETRASRMRFLGEDQEEITLVPGISWVSAVPSLDLVSSTSAPNP